MHALKIVSYLVAGFAVRTACQQAPLQDSLSVICEGGIPIGFNFPMTTLDETFTLQAISTNLTGDSLPLVEENSSLRYIRTKLGQADADGVPLTLKDGFVAREDGRDLQSRGGYGILLALAPHSKGSLTWQAEYKCKPGDTPALILSLTGKSAEQFRKSDRILRCCIIHSSVTRRESQA